jgi:hypothetical protein
LRELLRYLEIPLRKIIHGNGQNPQIPQLGGEIQIDSGVIAVVRPTQDDQGQLLLPELGEYLLSFPSHLPMKFLLGGKGGLQSSADLLPLALQGPFQLA